MAQRRCEDCVEELLLLRFEAAEELLDDVVAVVVAVVAARVARDRAFDDEDAAGVVGVTAGVVFPLRLLLRGVVTGFLLLLLRLLLLF